MTKENIPELLKKAINCWESLREPIADYGIVDPKRMIPHLVIDAFLSGYRDGAMAGHDHKIQVTRIYGARGADVFAEGMLSLHGDLIKIEGSRDLEMTAPEPRDRWTVNGATGNPQPLCAKCQKENALDRD